MVVYAADHYNTATSPTPEPTKKPVKILTLTANDSLYEIHVEDTKIYRISRFEFDSNKPSDCEFADLDGETKHRIVKLVCKNLTQPLPKV